MADADLFEAARAALANWTAAREALVADPSNDFLLAEAERAENGYLAAQAYAHASLEDHEQDGSYRA